MSQAMEHWKEMMAFIIKDCLDSGPNTYSQINRYSTQHTHILRFHNMTTQSIIMNYKMKVHNYLKSVFYDDWQ